MLGQQKDSTYIAPFGSATDDKFFNGLTFEFAVARGEMGGFEGPDDDYGGNRQDHRCLQDRIPRNSYNLLGSNLCTCI